MLPYLAQVPALPRASLPLSPIHLQTPPPTASSSPPRRGGGVEGAGRRAAAGGEGASRGGAWRRRLRRSSSGGGGGAPGLGGTSGARVWLGTPRARALAAAAAAAPALRCARPPGSAAERSSNARRAPAGSSSRACRDGSCAGNPEQSPPAAPAQRPAVAAAGR